MKRHFVVKLLALSCLGVYAHWNEIFVGDSLRDLLPSEFSYFKDFYGAENLRLSCEYIYEEDLDNFVSYDLDEEVFGVINA